MSRRPSKPRRPLVRMLPWKPEFHEVFSGHAFLSGRADWTPPARVRTVTSIDGHRCTWSARYLMGDGWIITANARLAIGEDRQVYVMDRWATMTCRLVSKPS